MNILVFQHIACEHPGIFRNFMSDSGVSWQTVELDEGEPIPSFDDFDAMLVMGGPMDVWQTEANPWLKLEIRAIREWVVEHKKPFFGFCLGHQLLAEALGGKVGPAKQPEIGIMPVQLTAAGLQSPLLENCPAEIQGLQWHSAEVTMLPAGAEILMSSPACEVNAMSWGEHAFSIQFHIEITSTTVKEWGEIPEYTSALEKALGKGALARFDTAATAAMPEFNAISKQLYDNFIALVQKREFGQMRVSKIYNWD